MKKITLLTALFAIGILSAKAQYKNSVGIDLSSYHITSINYERFLYSENNHHFSVRGVFGYGEAIKNYGLGGELSYGYGQNHRLEVGLGSVVLLKKYDYEEDGTSVGLRAALRIGYAYYAKDNPMIYRIAWVPFSYMAIGDVNFRHYEWIGLSLGVGYRF